MGIEQIRMMKEQAKLPKIKKAYQIPKKSAKRIQQEKDYAKDSDIIWEWFKEKRKQLNGRCRHCNGATTYRDDEKFHYSIAHILPKAYFPSVATHPENFIELCSYGNNCHGRMDNKTLDLIDMNCFDEIVTKFVKIYPSIEKSERRRIPQLLLNYIETEL